MKNTEVKPVKLVESKRISHLHGMVVELNVYDIEGKRHFMRVMPIEKYRHTDNSCKILCYGAYWSKWQLFNLIETVTDEGVIYTLPDVMTVFICDIPYIKERIAQQQSVGTYDVRD